LSGAAQFAGEALTAGTLLYLQPGRTQLTASCSGGARLLLIGGVPFGEEILLWWNFVARRVEEMGGGHG
jgi:redox-sensitive bicupin YhaK (pirin superfamily)